MAEAVVSVLGGFRFVNEGVVSLTLFYFILFYFQIAKAKGAYVVATCSPATQAFVSSLGADATVDYQLVKPSLPAYLAEHYPTSKTPGAFDLIFDTVGFTINELYAACPAFLKPDGTYLDVAGNAHAHTLFDLLTTFVSTANRLRPSWLGGTKRTYKALILFAAEMVCLLHSRP
jgi:NADPH:quinone reductase-like Zn-dependent oxidoreductase